MKSNNTDDTVKTQTIGKYLSTLKSNLTFIESGTNELEKSRFILDKNFKNAVIEKFIKIVILKENIFYIRSFISLVLCSSQVPKFDRD